MSIYIHFKFTDESERAYELKENLLIGRHKSCDVIIDKHAVSSRHAKISYTNDGKIIFKDLDSSNGSFYLGSRIYEIIMKINDEIRISDISISIMTSALSGTEINSIGKNEKYSKRELTLPELKIKKITNNEP